VRGAVPVRRLQRVAHLPWVVSDRRPVATGGRVM
jgi:hypothetical protein